MLKWPPVSFSHREEAQRTDRELAAGAGRVGLSEEDYASLRHDLARTDVALFHRAVRLAPCLAKQLF
jgi:hypothetical protein